MNSILILANNDVGLYNFRRELIEELITKEYKVYISLPYGKKVDDLVNIGCVFIETVIDRRGINPINDLKLIKFYTKIIKQIKPLCVLTYTIKPNIYGGLVCKKLKTPYLSNITGLGSSFNKFLLKKLVIMLYTKSLRKSSYIFFQNKFNLDTFLEYKIINNNYELINGSGINLNDFSFYEYPSENNGIVFNFIGRVMKEKGIEEYLHAAKLIKEKYPNTTFNIWGDVEETQLKYKEMIGHYEKLGYVVYGGFVDRNLLKDIIIKSHCTVLPSYNEGLANVLLESAALGRPLIVTNIPGCMETVENKKNGFIFKVKDENDLVIKIEEFLNLSFKERTQMGNYSRKKMEKDFDRNIIVKKYLDKIESIREGKEYVII